MAVRTVSSFVFALESETVPVCLEDPVDESFAFDHAAGCKRAQLAANYLWSVEDFRVDGCTITLRAVLVPLRMKSLGQGGLGR